MKLRKEGPGIWSRLRCRPPAHVLTKLDASGTTGNSSEQIWKNGDVIHARLELTSKTTECLFDRRRHLNFCGYDFCIYGQSVGSFFWLGLPRQRIESVLGGGRSLFSRWCFFCRILLV